MSATESVDQENDHQRRAFLFIDVAAQVPPLAFAREVRKGRYASDK